MSLYRFPVARYIILTYTPKAAQLANKCLEMAHDWLITMERPDNIDDHEFSLVICYASGFFVHNGILWKHDSQGAHKRVFYGSQRTDTMLATHNNTRHHGFYAMHALLVKQYWWPFMSCNIAWFVWTCHICQIRQTCQISIPPIIATLAPLFVKMYMDTMHLPQSSSFSYIIQGRCSLSHYLEFWMLRKETAQSIGDWIFQNILCCWGTLVEIVSDNGKPFIAARGHLASKYHIKHIQISGYNSHANGIVERSHFDVRQALFKASDGAQNRWSQSAQSVFWSEHVIP